jgi:Zn-dependent protease with chaperone function
VNEIRGLWFDGRDSRPRPATLSRPSDAAVRIVTEDETLDIATEALTISPRLGSTPRILGIPGRGQIECLDSPLLDAWFTPPSRIEAIADWLERRRTAALSAAVATLVGVVAFVKIGLPWAAERLAPQVPAAVERTMSQQVLALLDRVHLQPSRLAPERQGLLRREFRALVADLPREHEMRLEFRRAPAIGPNAFALPDGLVVMTDELVALAKSDEEILAVLAHEAGHHEHRHALRQTLESSGILVLTGLLFGDVSGSSLTVALPVVLLETGFSRGHEQEADDFALRILKRRGKSPQAFADILRRLSQKHGIDDSGAIGYVSTHPPSRERIARAERAAKKWRNR